MSKFIDPKKTLAQLEPMLRDIKELKLKIGQYEKELKFAGNKK